MYPSAGDEKRLEEMLDRVYWLSKLEKKAEPLEERDQLTANQRQVHISRSSIQAQAAVNTKGLLHKRQYLVCYYINFWTWDKITVFHKVTLAQAVLKRSV